MTVRLHFRFPRRCAGAGLLLATCLSIGPVLVAAPAAAQITVYDPTNFSQNVLTAARTLQQINNQIRSLQNEATMLLNQGKNLTSVSFPELQAITQQFQQIDRRMAQAQAIQFRVATPDREADQLFPAAADPSSGFGAQLAAARARMAASAAAYRQTMAVQSQIAENVSADAAALGAIVARSQGAAGALAVGQATNQLLALGAKQQFQIQQLMAAQYRAEAIEQARRDQAEADARATTRRFLGSGTAYAPQPPGH